MRLRGRSPAACPRCLSRSEPDFQRLKMKQERGASRSASERLRRRRPTPQSPTSAGWIVAGSVQSWFSPGPPFGALASCREADAASPVGPFGSFRRNPRRRVITGDRGERAMLVGLRLRARRARSGPTEARRLDLCRAHRGPPSPDPRGSADPKRRPAQRPAATVLTTTGWNDYQNLHRGTTCGSNENGSGPLGATPTRTQPTRGEPGTSSRVTLPSGSPVFGSSSGRSTINS